MYALPHVQKPRAGRAGFANRGVELKLKVRRGIYRIPVVIWLMIYQRLHPKGTLSEAVHFLARQSLHWKDQPDVCKPILLQQISVSTGGYCQARQKLPTLIASQVCDQI